MSAGTAEASGDHVDMFAARVPYTMVALDFPCLLARQIQGCAWHHLLLAVSLEYTQKLIDTASNIGDPVVAGLRTFGCPIKQ